MLDHLDKYAEIFPFFTARGNSKGELIDFFESSMGNIHIEPAYLDCLFGDTKKRRVMREVPREQWRTVRWRQTWNDLDGEVFDPWDTECTFSTPYTFFSHLRWLIRKSIEDPYSPQMLPLREPRVNTLAFIKLPGLKAAEICIHGNKDDSLKWMIDFKSWSGHPRVWQAGSRVLIPAR